MIEIRYAKAEEYGLIQKIDKSISKDKWLLWTSNKQAVFGFLNGAFAGWLQYGMFNEKIPFVNRIYVFEQYQRQAVGSFLILYCEDAVRNKGYQRIMLSTEKSNTAAQAFYKRHGYNVLGEYDCFGDYQELILGKELKEYGCCHKMPEI